jgi:MFS family permease
MTDPREPEAPSPAPDPAENPENFADQERLTLEADFEVPQPAMIRRGWVANTFRSFAHRDFTLFWSGALVSNVGSWMQNAALIIVVYSFAPKQASLYAGVVSFISGAPVFFLSIPAGAIADRFDRRKLLIWIQVVLLIQAAALGLLYDSHILGPSQPVQSLLLVSGLGLIAGIFSAFMMPAFQSLLPDLVPRKDLMNGIALNSAQFQSSRMIGPLVVSALVLAGASMGLIFYLNAASFLFVIAALLAVRSRPEFNVGANAPHGAAEESTLTRVLAGVAYAREHTAVGMLIISTAMLTIFGFPYMTLLAAIVGATLHVTPDKIGPPVATLMAFNGLGALVGALVVAGLPSTIPRNRVMPFTLLAFATFIIGFSLVHVLWAMALFSLLAGAALMSTNSLALTSIQSAVPGHLRGRVMALFVMSFMGIMPISALVFGPLGQAIGPDLAVLIAGVVLLGWAVLLVSRPAWLAGLQDADGNPTSGPGAPGARRG